MKNINVLVFPCGSEIGLEYHKALADVRYINLWGASSTSDHGEYVYRNYIPDAPYVTEEHFATWLKEIVQEKNIDVICPAMDSVIPVFARLVPEIECKVLAPSTCTADICRNKISTYNLFRNETFNPLYWTSANGATNFPVALKPAVGQGSQGFKVVHDYEELEEELKTRSSTQVICEYLPGNEYTIDCLSDRHGAIRFIAQRERARTKAGISVRSQDMDVNDEVLKIASTINRKLQMRGVWFFQVKKNGTGSYKLLEVAPRVAGTMGLERARGVNLPALAILDAMDYDFEVMPNDYHVTIDRAFGNAFSLDCDYQSVYIDYDDTIIRQNEVNTETIAFLYQCYNKKIPVHLLTRHETDIHESLASFCISERLFSSITKLPDGANKSTYIDSAEKPVFIDDSFAERKAVYEELHIPTFGPESIEALMDYRK